MASISSPTSLSTFSQPHASSSKNPHVRMNSVVGDAKSGVVGVQGGGVWIFDLTTLRASTSFSVPPSTVFTTAPISFWATRPVSVKSKGKEATEDDGMDVDEEEEDEGERGRATGEEDVEGVKERVTAVGVGSEVWVWRGDKSKEVIRLKSPVNALHYLPSSSTPILAVSSPFQLHLLASSDAEPALITAVNPSGLSDLLVSKVLSGGQNQCVRLAVVDVTGRIEVSSLWFENKRSERLSEGKIGSGKLLVGDISDDGVISVIDNQQQLFSTSIRTLSTPAVPIKLVRPSPSPQLLSLPSATLPLLLVPTNLPTPSLLLAIPSSSLPSVLTTTPLSSFSSAGTISSICILATKGGVHTVGVVLSHKHDGTEGSVGRSVVYTCEVGVPDRGIGVGMLLGTKSKTEEFFQVVAPGGGEKKSQVEKKEDAVVLAIENKLKNLDVQGAEKAWAAYPSSEHLSDGFVKRVVRAVFSAALSEEGKPKGVYAREIVQSLVKRGAVSDGMWKEGVVVDGLLPLNDWETILVALSKIRTLTSATLVKLVSTSIQSPDTPGCPTLRVLLQAILALPPPGPAYKLDLHTGLNVQDATAVLEVLTDWVEGHVEASAGTLIGWDGAEEKMEGDDRLPSIQSTITHSSLLLDAHLPSFLSHPASHAVLERMQSSLDPLLDMQSEYRQLRGPVEALLTLARREAKKAEGRMQKKGRKGKKQDGERLPEEIVGKWKVEDIVL